MIDLLLGKLSGCLTPNARMMPFGVVIGNSPAYQLMQCEGVSPENSEFSSASLSGTDIALPNLGRWVFGRVKQDDI